MPDAKSCTVKIIRGAQFADYIRSYSVLIDGVEAGTIARNSTLERSVTPGGHTIEARIDWGRCKPLEIDVKPGETVEIAVKNTWGPLLAIWAITGGKNTYLTLTRKSA